MKMKFLTMALGACFAMPALAQTNVTLYGILDAGIQVSKNGKDTQTKMVSGIADGSRIGFKGTEDMGGGYKAIFNLEARVEVDTGSNKTGNLSDYQGYALTKGMNFPDFGSAALKGAAAQTLAGVRSALQPKYNVNATSPLILSRGGGPDGGLFDRMAMVGLITPVGAVLAGRMYTPAYEVFNSADAFESGMAGSWGGITGGTGGLLTAGMAIRSNKSVQYRIELPNGFGGSLMYGFKNSGYIGLDKDFMAGNVRYKANGFDVGLGYNRGTNTDGSTGLVTSTIGGSYAFDDFKFFAGYQTMRNENSILLPVFYDAWDLEITPGLRANGVPAPVIAAWTTIFRTNITKNFKLDANSYSLGMHYKLGNGRVMASYSHQDDRTLSNSDVTQYGLGYNYNMSKRTDVYAVVGYTKNQNDGQYAPGAASASGGFTEFPGEPGRVFQFGIRHRF
jgi:predicted porin